MASLCTGAGAWVENGSFHVQTGPEMNYPGATHQEVIDAFEALFGTHPGLQGHTRGVVVQVAPRGLDYRLKSNLART